MTRSAFDPVLTDAQRHGDLLLSPALDAAEMETVELLLDAIRTWLGRSVDPFAIDAAGKMPPEVLDAAKDMGLFGLGIPEEYGGAGLSMTAVTRVIEEIARVDRSVATAIGLHNGLGLQGLIRFGSQDLKREVLPKMAAGMIGAFSATEAEAGSHIAGLKTTAVDQGDGTLLVNGEKIYVTNGGFAQVYTVLVRSPGLGGARRGTSVLLVDRDTPGFSVGREEHKLGIKASSTTTLLFEDARVPLSRVIGEPGKGLEQLAQILAWGRTVMAAGTLGTAKAAYDTAVAHALTRRQFGRPIAKFGLVREKVAWMRAQLYGAESAVRLTTQIEGLGRDITWESSIAKVLGSETAWAVSDDALQTMGGAGYMEEAGVARALRDGRITRIFEGANEVLRGHIASAAFDKRAAAAAGEAPLLAPSIVTAELADEAARVDAFGARIDETVAALRERLGIRVFNHQVLLGALADAYIARWTLLATVLRTDALARRDGVAKASGEVSLTALLGARLQRRLDEALTRALDLDEESLIEVVSGHEYGLL